MTALKASLLGTGRGTFGTRQRQRRWSLRAKSSSEELSNEEDEVKRTQSRVRRRRQVTAKRPIRSRRRHERAAVCKTKAGEWKGEAVSYCICPRIDVDSLSQIGLPSFQQCQYHEDVCHFRPKTHTALSIVQNDCQLDTTPLIVSELPLGNTHSTEARAECESHSDESEEDSVVKDTSHKSLKSAQPTAGYWSAPEPKEETVSEHIAAANARTSERIVGVLPAASSGQLPAELQSDVFVFSYGCVVFWNCDSKIIETLIEEISRNGDICDISDCNPQKDDIEFMYLEEEKGSVATVDTSTSATASPPLTTKMEECVEFCVKRDVIKLRRERKPSKEALRRVSLSFALALSVKIGVFEDELEAMVAANAEFPEQMRRSGKVPLNSFEATRKLGALFAFRKRVNLDGDFLDADPEFFWDNDDFAAQYKELCHYLQIERRVGFINSRLSVLQEMYHFINERLQDAHASKLEWIIIVLIVLEVSIGFLDLMRNTRWFNWF